MSLKRSETALIVKLHTSRQLLLLMLLMHGLAMLILWPLYERLGLSVLLLIPFLFASLTWVMRRYVLLTSKYAITEIILKTNSEYVLAVGGDGLYVLATLRRGSYVHPLLIILNFKLKRWPWYVSIPLLTDSADEDALRRLRVRLRTMRDGELETLA